MRTERGGERLFYHILAALLFASLCGWSAAALYLRIPSEEAPALAAESEPVPTGGRLCGLLIAAEREKDGAVAVHFLNATGVNNKAGEKIVDAAPNPAFPTLKEDIRFAVPANGAASAAATSPEFKGERELKAKLLPDGRTEVVVPKELLGAYLFVRIR